MALAIRKLTRPWVEGGAELPLLLVSQMRSAGPSGTHGSNISGGDGVVQLMMYVSTQKHEKCYKKANRSLVHITSNMNFGNTADIF